MAKGGDGAIVLGITALIGFIFLLCLPKFILVLAILGLVMGTAFGVSGRR
jgi:hypothetical protein